MPDTPPAPPKPPGPKTLVKSIKSRKAVYAAVAVLAIGIAIWYRRRQAASESDATATDIGSTEYAPTVAPDYGNAAYAGGTFSGSEGVYNGGYGYPSDTPGIQANIDNPSIDAVLDIIRSVQDTVYSAPAPVVNVTYPESVAGTGGGAPERPAPSVAHMPQVATVAPVKPVTHPVAKPYGMKYPFNSDRGWYRVVLIPSGPQKGRWHYYGPNDSPKVKVGSDPSSRA